MPVANRAASASPSRDSHRAPSRGSMRNVRGMAWSSFASVRSGPSSTAAVVSKLRLFGSSLEKDGGWKVFSYVVDD